MSVFEGKRLTIKSLLGKYFSRISITWLLTLAETALSILTPLFIGFAIDGLLEKELADFYWLGAVLGVLILLSVARRIYDTRIYGTIRVEFGEELISRSSRKSVSTQNAQLGMSRELVDFLEEQVPALMNSIVQLAISFLVLFFFHPSLAYAAMVAAGAMIGIYAVFHRRFFRLNAEYNQQTELQVSVLEEKSKGSILSHLNLLREAEVKLSDNEALVYGAIFAVLLAFLLFNLWFTATNLAITAGAIFSIVSYSWEFVEAALVLPMTMQGWSRLSEIMKRINSGNEIQ
ncbi:MAG: ABC transporter six-transmembrane domain-containing protein [Pseudomonadota bacterium]